MSIIEWTITEAEEYLILSFDIKNQDGILDCKSLGQIELPQQTHGRGNLGIVFSGKGPVWLYAYLTHKAHSFAWTGVYDPRLQGAVVVQRHTPNSPELGQIMNCKILMSP